MPSFLELLRQQTRFGRTEMLRYYERLAKVQEEFNKASPERQRYLDWFYSRHGV